MNLFWFLTIGTETILSLSCLTFGASPYLDIANSTRYDDIIRHGEKQQHSCSILIAQVPAKFGRPRPLDDIESDSPTESDSVTAAELKALPIEEHVVSPNDLSLKKPTQRRLKGFVNHSDALPPLPDRYLVGKVYSSEASQTLNSRLNQLQRFPVPEWLAGVWLRTKAKEVSRVELPSGRKVRPLGTSTAQVRDTFGSYRDQHGQVWQLFSEGRSSGQIDRGIALDYHNVHSYDLIITSPRSAVVEVLATHMVVSKDSRRILSVYQDEELNSYTLTGSGQLRTDSSVKVFDMFGKPIFLTRAISLEQKIAPFAQGITLPLRDADINEKKPGIGQVRGAP